MSDKQRNYLIKAAAFSIGFQLLMMLIAALAGAYPHTRGPITTFKATFTVGMPWLDQLLDPGHQITFTSSWTSPAFLLWMIVTTVVYSWVNGYYIALLARSTRDLSGTPAQAASRAFPKLLFWMIAQMGVTVLCMPLIVILNFFGGLIAMALMLWFRYAFMFFEYLVVIEGTAFVEAFYESRVMRQQVRDEAGKYFVMIVIANVILALLVNGLYSAPAVFLFLLINVVFMTVAQRYMLGIFNRALR